MDTNQFDDLTMALAEWESRRSLLRRLFLGGAITAGDHGGINDLAAAAQSDVAGGSAEQQRVSPELPPQEEQAAAAALPATLQAADRVQAQSALHRSADLR